MSEGKYIDTEDEVGRTSGSCGKTIDEEDVSPSTGGGKTIDAADISAGTGGSSSQGQTGSGGGKEIDMGDDTEEEEEEKSLMEQTMDYCRTRDFLKIFEDYIINHIKYFKDAEEEEHRLEWTKIFEDYLKLFEDVLASFIDKKGGNYAAFYRECREKQDIGTPEEKHFLKLLLASADYQDFSRIMVREARYYYSTGISHFGYVPPEAVEMDDKYQDPRFAKGK